GLNSPFVERMGLVDHQWALVRARRASIDTFLELTTALGSEPDPDVLMALRKPLAFLANSLIPHAAPESEERFRAWLLEHFGPAFESLGWDPARGEADDVRVRRAVLLGIVGVTAESASVVETARRRCDAYLTDRHSLDANLADGVVTLAARVGDDDRRRQFLDAMENADTPQEKRRFMLAAADFRDPKLITEALMLSLSERVPTQDVGFLLIRLMANPAARERTWAFIKRRWPRLRKRIPALFASRLVDSTPNLLTPAHR
ncbi:unnamed protein product, partial [marine sediment metagenome]